MKRDKTHHTHKQNYLTTCPQSNFVIDPPNEMLPREINKDSKNVPMFNESHWSRHRRHCLDVLCRFHCGFHCADDGRLGTHSSAPNGGEDGRPLNCGTKNHVTRTMCVGFVLTTISPLKSTDPVFSSLVVFNFRSFLFHNFCFALLFALPIWEMG